jgi:hypothetical protein
MNGRWRIKILLLDIETAPNTVFTWGLFNQYVGLEQIIKPGYTLSWAAKWLGESEVMFESIASTSPKKMIQRIHKLIDQADAVVHYNGSKFDMPVLNKEFLLHKLPPPSPVQQIDLLRTVRKQFRLSSNKLDFVAQSLGLGSKESHKGFSLWVGCMNKDKESWEIMERYNKQDVVLLESLYNHLLPWIKSHPNMSVFHRTECCPHCSSKDYQKRGIQLTRLGEYQRYRCNKCNTWFRSNHTLAKKDKMVAV